MSVVLRPPSVAWEAVAIPGAAGCYAWVWFKPGGGELDLLFQVPPESIARCGPAVTLRNLLLAIGLDPRAVESWTLHGVTYPSQGGQSPLVDLPIPLPPPGLDSTIAVRLSASAWQQTAAPRSQLAPTADAARLLAAIETDWQAILQAERHLDGVRKQLGAMQGRLQSLNRDLSPDERLHADNLDKKDWQDARRWLRDVAAQVSRYIRDHDIGLTSSAGSRNRFDQVYKDFVEPKRPFEGMEATQKEFESYRKTVQSLLLQMQAAHANAARDGEQRAQQVLARIAARVRTARTKR